MINSFDKIVKKARELENVVIAVAGSENEDVLNSVEIARKNSLCTSLLVGDIKKTKEIMKRLKIDEKNYSFMNAKDEIEASKLAVIAVREGRCDFLMKGFVQTSSLLKAALNREEGIRDSSLLSYAGIFELEKYHKLLVITDPAINILPDLKAKVSILENAKKITDKLNIKKPKVGVLCAKEQVSDKMIATLDAKKLKEMNLENFLIDGPFALDNALDKEKAKIKGLDSVVAGDVDILLMPNIETGNALYKAFTMFSECKCGGIVLGATKPIIMTSRTDSVDTKINAIALAVVMSKE